MSDRVPVRAAADVLADALRARKEHLRKHEFNVNCDTDEEVARLALAALASVCGDGPIVIMQDGTLWGVLPRDGGPKPPAMSDRVPVRAAADVAAEAVLSVEVWVLLGYSRQGVVAEVVGPFDHEPVPHRDVDPDLFRRARLAGLDWKPRRLKPGREALRAERGVVTLDDGEKYEVVAHDVLPGNVLPDQHTLTVRPLSALGDQTEGDDDYAEICNAKCPPEIAGAADLWCEKAPCHDDDPEPDQHEHYGSGYCWPAGGQLEGEPERCGGAGSWADCPGCPDCSTDPERCGATTGDWACTLPLDHDGDHHAQRVSTDPEESGR